MSPFEPNGKARKVKSSLLSTNHCPDDGLKIAMSVLPSPVKSAGTGISVGTPKTVAKTELSALLLSHHSMLPRFDRVMPMSDLPSPSKSNGAPEYASVITDMPVRCG